MSLNKLTLLIFSLVLSISLAAQDTAEKFERANNAYIEGNFDESESLYQGLIDNGYDSAELYYNLGNTYFRMDQIPQAILYYEKALKINPRNKDYQYNLDIAKSKIAEPLEEVPEFFLNNWWRNMANWMPSTGWSVIGLVFLWIGIAGGIFWLIGRERRHRKLGFLIGVMAFAFCFLPFLLAKSNVQMSQETNAAIIMQHGIALKSAPESDQDLANVPGGTKVNLLDKIGTWHKVQLPNGETGWLPGVVFEEI